MRISDWSSDVCSSDLIFALEALVELARILALIAARDLPAERQLARTLADARPGDMVGRTVEAAAARDSRRHHVRRVDVDLGIAEAIACADVPIADPPRQRRSGK